MQKLVSRIVLGTIVLCLLIMLSVLIVLSAPHSLVILYVLVAGIMLLATVIELIYVFMATQPKPTEDQVCTTDENWTDALIKGTAAELIDWEN